MAQTPQQTPQHLPTVVLPVKWEIEMPQAGARDDMFGGCRGIEDTYTRIRQIGEGTYGQVYLAQNNKTKELVALKKIRMDNEKEGFPITAIREIKLLSMLKHENVIGLREIVRSQVHKVNNFKGSIYMVCDYMDHDLTGLMERCNYKFTLPQIKCYMKQLLNGLAFCHKQKVLHRDLKASNLLINNKGELKLADFGLARPFKDANHGGKLTNRVITLWYRPPELILGADTYGPEVDVWSVGCILAELLLGKPLFPGKDEADQLNRISSYLGLPNETNMPGFSKLQFAHLVPEKGNKRNRLRELLGEKLRKSPGAIELLENLLVLDPKKRLTAAQALHDGEPRFFWVDPMPCQPSELPKFEASHEMDMKARRHAAKEQAQGRHPPAHGQPDPKRPKYGHPQGQQQRAPTGGAPSAARRHDGAAGYAPPGDGRDRRGGAYPSGGGYSGAPAAAAGRGDYGQTRGAGGYPPTHPPARDDYRDSGRQAHGSSQGYGREGYPPQGGYPRDPGRDGGYDGSAGAGYRSGAGPPPPTAYPPSATGYGAYPYAAPGGAAGGYGAGGSAAAAGAYGAYGAAVQAQLAPAAGGAARAGQQAPRVGQGRPPPPATGAGWEGQKR